MDPLHPHVSPAEKIESKRGEKIKKIREIIKRVERRINTEIEMMS